MTPAPAQGTPRTVSVLAYPGMSAFETGIVTEVFGLPRPELDVPWYELTVCAERPDRPVPLVGGATLTTTHGLDVFAAADTVIVPGVPDVAADPTPELVAALRRARAGGARLMSICSGTFALAATGLLDGAQATTHWRYADRLQQRYPAVHVVPEVLYLESRGIYTSAGSAAGLDLCLHVIRLDHGAAVANAVARRLVVQPHRSGGQAQFIEAPMPAGDGDDRIARSMQWAIAHLDRPLTVEVLARGQHMSPRSYLRHFARATGTTPVRWLIRQRVQASLAALEGGDTPVEQVAAAVGFDSVVTFRHHFRAQMMTSPSAYRRAFRAGTPVTGGSGHVGGGSLP